MTERPTTDHRLRVTVIGSGSRYSKASGGIFIECGPPRGSAIERPRSGQLRTLSKGHDSRIRLNMRGRSADDPCDPETQPPTLGPATSMMLFPRRSLPDPRSYSINTVVSKESIVGGKYSMLL